jgi:hypothetical protein
MSSRSIRSSRRRASRERWSSSTLDKLRLHRLMRGMAPSMVLAPSTGQERSHTNSLPIPQDV